MDIEKYFTEEKPMDEISPVFFKPELLDHPNIPLPLHGLAPRTFMKKSEWDVIRRKAYKENNYCCWACGMYHPFDKDKNVFIDRKLHAHESYIIDYDKCSMELKEIVALCEFCHNTIHSGRMNALYDKKIMDEEDCWLIESHGERVLGKPKKMSIDEKDYINNWKKWHLIINGEKFYSKFLSYEEWRKHYE